MQYPVSVQKLHLLLYRRFFMTDSLQRQDIPAVFREKITVLERRNIEGLRCVTAPPYIPTRLGEGLRGIC